ncbi:hypothetical protein TWF281_003231 [Arthrobotrys megalospora]
MYFDPESHAGNTCRDGGLTANNPAFHAFEESRRLWGDKTRYDLFLSIGPGKAPHPQNDNPRTAGTVPWWLFGIFTSFLRKMNGEAAWRKFYGSRDKVLQARLNRVNVDIRDTPGDKEPAFDDVGLMEKMEDAAKAYGERYVLTADSPYEPILGPCTKSLLEIQADILRAGQYFFQLESINPNSGKPIITGRLKCLLGPRDWSERLALKSLVAKTKFFRINKRTAVEIGAPFDQFDAFDIPIRFEHENRELPIRIDVSFGEPHLIAISGFPMDFKVLEEYHKKVIIEPSPHFSEGRQPGSAKGGTSDVKIKAVNLERAADAEGE